MSVFTECQVVAFLFKNGATVEVAVENPPRVDIFELENSDKASRCWNLSWCRFET